MTLLKGSKTEKNLALAFAGESEARNKYSFYAAVAKREGYEEVADLFKATANNEKFHAELWFNHLKSVGTTEENLKTAAEGERYEWASMYMEFAKQAREEGFEDIAKQFDHVAAIERSHEGRFKAALAALEMRAEESEMFTQATENSWVCKNCGHVFIGETKPECCPVCQDSKTFFKDYFQSHE